MENKIPERIKELRLEMNLSQMMLSKKTGLKQGSISRWEAGERAPSIDALIVLALFFKVSLDYLVGLED